MTNTQFDFNVHREFLDIPLQMRTWIAARAFRRMLPVMETLIRHVSDGDTTVSGKSRQAILFTELYICVPSYQLDDSWATDFRMNIDAVADRLFHPDGVPLESWQKALWELKPRHVGKWGNQLGSPSLALNECSKALDHLAWIYFSHVRKEELFQDWNAHIFSDIEHYREILRRIDPDGDANFKCTLSDMELVFSYLPETYEEPDTQYLRPLFATDSILKTLKLDTDDITLP